MKPKKKKIMEGKGIAGMKTETVEGVVSIITGDNRRKKIKTDKTYSNCFLHMRLWIIYVKNRRIFYLEHKKQTYQNPTKYSLMYNIQCRRYQIINDIKLLMKFNSKVHNSSIKTQNSNA